MSTGRTSTSPLRSVLTAFEDGARSRTDVCTATGLRRDDAPPIFVAGPAARGYFGELMGLPQVADHAAAVAAEALSSLRTLKPARCPVS